MNPEDENTRRDEQRIAREATTTGDKLSDLRRIVERRTMGHVIHDGALVPVDLYSASAIVTVYDALSPARQERYLAMHPLRMANIAFKLL